MFPVQSRDGWFRVGRVEVTSTVALVAIGAVGIIFGAFVPAMIPLTAFHPTRVLAGAAWTPFTWPLLDGISIFSVLSLFILWYFGSDLEQQLGKVRMAWLYVACWAALTAVTFGVGMVLPGTGFLVGLGQIQFLVMLLWIADNPRRPFFFGVPAWVIGAVLVGVQVLQLIAGRLLGTLVALLLVFVIIAVVARRLGLLTDYAWIPGRATPRQARAPKVSRAAQRQQTRRSEASSRIDEMLDKINAEGIHSLTKAERKELDKLRQQRRG